MTTLVFSKPNCNQCDMTKRWLTDRALAYTELDITTDAHMELARTFGVQAAPMIIVTDSPLTVDSASIEENPLTQETLPQDAIVFSGFRPDVLQSLFPEAAAMPSAA